MEIKATLAELNDFLWKYHHELTASQKFFIERICSGENVQTPRGFGRTKCIHAIGEFLMYKFDLHDGWGEYDRVIEERTIPEEFRRVNWWDNIKPIGMIGDNLEIPIDENAIYDVLKEEDK